MSKVAGFDELLCLCLVIRFENVVEPVPTPTLNMPLIFTVRGKVVQDIPDHPCIPAFSKIRKNSPELTQQTILGRVTPGNAATRDDVVDIFGGLFSNLYSVAVFKDMEHNVGLDLHSRTQRGHGGN
ncbi:hypothetical protein FEK35_12505 [Nocardia cyriacigeorgica]|uniref:Uncharacterized protein n=1 Tax=Nocardia cyriacigeorgica TaxID=135487 RepID=A0A5R8PF79_9NOCA|nr:hypothetical protein FEK35_12505 [Nocardia cyriacigeorgica]